MIRSARDLDTRSWQSDFPRETASSLSIVFLGAWPKLAVERGSPSIQSPTGVNTYRKGLSAVNTHIFLHGVDRTFIKETRRRTIRMRHRREAAPCHLGSCSVSLPLIGSILSDSSSSSESIQVIRESATMQCQHEHEQCGGHGGHDHSHDHDHDHDVEDANGESLYPYIDTSKLRVLNAEDPTHVAHPFKPYHDREDHTRFLNSNEDDPEMIIYIPFTEAVSIKSICISGGEDGAHPKTVKLFTNRDDIDFSNAGELPPQQKLELVEDHIGQIDYPLQIRKFQGVSSITLFIEDSYNGDDTRIYYIGMKGESKKWRHGVVEAVYESRPQAADHKVKDMMGSRALN